MTNLWSGKALGIKPAAPKFTIEKVPVTKKPAPAPSKLTSRPATSSSGSSSAKIPGPISSGSNSPATPKPGSNLNAKRKAAKQKSPAPKVQFEADSSSSSDDNHSHKRQKMGVVKDDPKRRFRSSKGFSEEDGGVFEMVHAADIASGPKSKNGAVRRPTVTVELKYPSASQRERYALIFGKEDIDPLKDIQEVADLVTKYYLTEEQAKDFREPNAGIIRQIEKTKNILSNNPYDESCLNNFKAAVDRYNTAVENLIKDGALAKNLDRMLHMESELVQVINRQVYDRTVSPEIESLTRYQKATKDNTYGELQHSFVSRIFKETRIKSDNVFVDLGSGVGNVVLQAALQVGCESWGCEMMENACDLADAQEKEFDARCRLWGIQPGKVHLERGDFLENRKIHAALKRADVVLVNNEVFSSELNQSLIQLFLDLKEGCQIVSLKTFVPAGHQITSRNQGDPISLLRNRKREYYRGDVSWADKGGDYYIATKDSARLKLMGLTN